MYNPLLNHQLNYSAANNLFFNSGCFPFGFASLFSTVYFLYLLENVLDESAD